VTTRIYLSPSGVPSKVIVDGVELQNVAAATVDFEPAVAPRIHIVYTDKDLRVIRADEFAEPDDTGPQTLGQQ